MIYIVSLNEAGQREIRPYPLSKSDEASLIAHTVTLDGYSRLITKFTKGRSDLPVGTLVLTSATPSINYFTNNSQFQDTVALATLGELICRAYKHALALPTTYFNLSSLALIHAANNNPQEIFKPDGTSDPDCLDTMLQQWDTPNNDAFYLKIDNGFQLQLQYLHKIAKLKKMPLNAFTQGAIETQIDMHLKDVFPQIFSVLRTDPKIASDVYDTVGGQGKYYLTHRQKISDALDDPDRILKLVNPSDSIDQQDTFPSLAFLQQIQSLAKDSRTAITTIKTKAYQLMRKLCTYYVLREMIELIAIKASNPTHIIATKYANPYNKDIIASICIIGIAKFGNLQKFLTDASKAANGLKMLTLNTICSAEDLSFINLYLNLDRQLNSDKPIFEQFIAFLTKSSTLLHTYETGGTDTGTAKRPRVTPQCNTPRVIVAVCSNEVLGKPPECFNLHPFRTDGMTIPKNNSPYLLEMYLRVTDPSHSAGFLPANPSIPSTGIRCGKVCAK